MTNACDPTRPFGAVTPLAAFNTTASDDAVSLSRDRLTAYLSSNRPGGVGGYDIWIATRTALTQGFAAPTLLEGVNTPQDERSPVTNRDGLQLFFTSNFQASGLHDIRVSSRPSTLAAFSASAPLAGINSASNDASQWLAADDTLIYFFSDRPGGVGQYDIYVSTLGSTGASNVRGVGELNTLGFDTAPVVTPDGLTIFFSSNRADVDASGSNDIWTARRSTSSDGFGTPRIVAEVNTPNSDAVTWVSADGCTIYIQSRPRGEYRRPRHEQRYQDAHVDRTRSAGCHRLRQHGHHRGQHRPDGHGRCPATASCSASVTPCRSRSAPPIPRTGRSTAQGRR